MRALRRFTLRLLGCLFVVYLALCGLMVVKETSLVYMPFNGTADPHAAGLPDFTRRELTQRDAPPIVYWENNAVPGQPTILYFHGNGGGLYMHAPAIAELAHNKFHVVAMEYPGYPGALGRPSQSLIVSDAVALYDAVHHASPQTPLVIWGYSLGSGVATQLTAVRPPAVLILEAPFTAAVDRAAEIFPFVPVRLLMRNQYRSREAIGHIHAPLFIMHGDEDHIIPSHHGDDLFALGNEPKTIRHYPGAGHLDLLKAGAHDDAVAFIRAQLKAPF